LAIKKEEAMKDAFKEVAKARDNCGSALWATAYQKTLIRMAEGASNTKAKLLSYVWGYKHAEACCPDEDGCELCSSLGEIEDFIKKELPTKEELLEALKGGE
jgi:hypothetical protein